MMRSALLLIGLLIVAPVPAIAETKLYDMFLNQVKQEFSNEKADDPVIEFLKAIYKDRWPMTKDEVKAAILGQPWKACVPDDDTAPQRLQGECDDALQNIRQLAEEEQTLRTFGRNIQRIAAGQELPISEIPGRPFRLATDLSGIINIWRAGTGSVQHTVSGATMVRTRPLDEDETERIVEIFEDANDDGIADMSLPDAHSGLVWRYQYGVRLVLGERNPRYPPPIEDSQSFVGTERQYFFKNWVPNSSGGAGWEHILKDVWRELPKERDDFDPPLSKNEVAYILFPDEVQSLMPEGMLLWARVDQAYQQGSGDDHPLGDVGIVWKYPIEPPLPSILHILEGKIGEPILGGRYPPEPAEDASSDDNGNPLPPGTKKPIDGRGLCSMALAQRGFLCRSLKPGGEQRCPEDDVSNDENVITLVSCTLEDKPTVTVAGADVCREIEWLNGEQKQRCNVEFQQGPCPGGDVGVAFQKEPNGTITLCLDENVDGPVLTYIMEHEMVHAQQYCSMEAGNVYEKLDNTEADALCCRLEGEAHLVNCKRMIEDGVIQNEDGSPLIIGGIEITAQTCMEMMRPVTCTTHREREVRCPSTIPFDLENSKKLYEAMTNGGNPKDLPDTFDEATDPETMDARIAARLRTIERHIPICEPGTEIAYKNTIGNNACYIGQCMEETLELHRVTGGRSPTTVGDEAFPWDTPEMGSALATMLRSVPAANPPLPSYRPQVVMRMLEDALCQLQGLPAATPPHLCAFSSSRRLAIPLADGASTTQSLVYSADEQREATRLMEALGASLGSRIGTDMQGQYLRIGTRTLSEVIALANTLLKELKSVRFPTNMCTLSL